MDIFGNVLTKFWIENKIKELDSKYNAAVLGTDVGSKTGNTQIISKIEKTKDDIEKEIVDKLQKTKEDIDVQVNTKLQNFGIDVDSKIQDVVNTLVIGFANIISLSDTYIDVGNRRITDMADPIDEEDGVNKRFFDNEISNKLQKIKDDIKKEIADKLQNYDTLVNLDYFKSNRINIIHLVGKYSAKEKVIYLGSNQTQYIFMMSGQVNEIKIKPNDYKSFTEAYLNTTITPVVARTEQIDMNNPFGVLEGDKIFFKIPQSFNIPEGTIIHIEMIMMYTYN